MMHFDIFLNFCVALTLENSDIWVTHHRSSTGTEGWVDGMAGLAGVLSLSPTVMPVQPFGLEPRRHLPDFIDLVHFPCSISAESLLFFD